jgi:tRNA (cytidine32/uridine32-2'-O)-methyltransferase
MCRVRAVVCFEGVGEAIFRGLTRAAKLRPQSDKGSRLLLYFAPFNSPKAQRMQPLSQVRIVMIGTTHPGNIGAAARAMKNMGLTDLALVEPKVFPSDEAVARAAGAGDILDAARLCGTLEEAIADCERVIGASARLRSIPWPQLDPRECAALVTGSRAKTAILFGREHSGLSNEDLERCHYLLHIPCNPEYSSLNVAAALQVVSYELFYASSAQAAAILTEAPSYATGEQMESFFGHLEEVLRDSRFLHESKHEASILRRLRRIFNRAHPEEAELHLLRGILSAVQRQLRAGG